MENGHFGQTSGSYHQKLQQYFLGEQLESHKYITQIQTLMKKLSYANMCDIDPMSHQSL